MDIRRALKLSPNMFTPLQRTPWGGKTIARTYKAKFVADPTSTVIGESWEISCDPAFPSEVLTENISLSDLIRSHPEEMLSARYIEDYGPNCDILVKLINADDPLSVQVHPTDDDPNLKPGECGKPESWLVLQADPGAGLYLGFSKPISKPELKELLANDGDLRPYLQFVPVKEGDYFEINPGVIHAVGPGVTLLEPQRVRIGKAGKTYRFWDWGRRYDADGSQNMTSGQPRELHIDQGLKLIDPEKQVGIAFVAKLRGRAETKELGSLVTHSSYPPNAHYQVHILKMKAGARIKLSAKSGFLTFVCLAGEADFGNDVKVSRGEPGFIPYKALPMLIEVPPRGSEDCEIALVVPSGTDLLLTAI